MTNVIATDKTNTANPMGLSDTFTKPLLVSKMTGKLEGFRAINTNTLSNAYCIAMANHKNPDVICTNCYSVDMLLTSRKNCVSPWERNSQILSTLDFKDPDNMHHIPRFMPGEYVRFSGHGELINELHMDNLVTIAEANPRAYFVLWTKRAKLVKKYTDNDNALLPKNMHLIYSNARSDRIQTKPPTGFEKVFNAIDPAHRKPEHNVNCHAKCRDCMICYELNDIKVIVEVMK